MLANQMLDDIVHKYVNSVIFFDGDPILVTNALMDMVNKKDVLCVQFKRLGPNPAGAKLEHAPASDPAFMDGPFKLGYVNGLQQLDLETAEMVTGCSFCSRVPVRRFKQGLSAENMHFQGNVLGFQKALGNPGFIEMLKGKYPTYKQAKALLGDKVRRVAYHRHWAVGLGKVEQAELYYRGQLVGIGEDVKTLKLGPKFTFLKESFKISQG